MFAFVNLNCLFQVTHQMDCMVLKLMINTMVAVLTAMCNSSLKNYLNLVFLIIALCVIYCLCTGSVLGMLYFVSDWYNWNCYYQSFASTAATCATEVYACWVKSKTWLVIICIFISKQHDITAIVVIGIFLFSGKKMSPKFEIRISQINWLTEVRYQKF